MSNVRALYYKAIVIRRRVALVTFISLFCFTLFASKSVIAASIVALFFGLLFWWAWSKEVDKWRSIYHIGEKQ